MAQPESVVLFEHHQAEHVAFGSYYLSLSNSLRFSVMLK